MDARLPRRSAAVVPAALGRARHHLARRAFRTASRSESRPRLEGPARPSGRLRRRPRLRWRSARPPRRTHTARAGGDRHPDSTRVVVRTRVVASDSPGPPVLRSVPPGSRGDRLTDGSVARAAVVRPAVTGTTVVRPAVTRTAVARTAV